MSQARDKQSVDFWLLLSILFLAGFGLVIVYSSSMYMSMEEAGSPMYFMQRQAVRLAIGLAIMLVLTKLNYRGFANIALALLVGGLGCLAVLHYQKIVSGSDVHRWLRLGPFVFQPSEFMKFFLIVYLAATLADKGKNIREWRNGFLPLFAVVVLSAILVVLEPDLGSAGLLLVSGLYLLFIGRAKLGHLLAVIIPAVLGLVFIVNAVPYMHRRWELFLHPENSYQLRQSIISIGSGGLFGVGLGNSTQKFLFLPEHHTDFVFSILAEELGFIRTSVILLLLLFFVWRGMKIASEAPDMFGFYLGSGLSFIIGIQVFINIGVAVGLLPTTGMTLPFFSYGGSSLLMTCIASGVLLNISRQRNFEQGLSREYGKRRYRKVRT